MSIRRSWFQIHLSTAVVLMVVSGAIIGLNATWHNAVLMDPQDGPQYAHGWPVQCFIQNGRYSVVTKGIAELHVNDGLTSKVITEWLLPNVLTALGILWAVALLLEWRIRRREARAQ